MKISEIKLRRIVRTIVEQMDRSSYRPSWEDDGVSPRPQARGAAFAGESHKALGDRAMKFIDSIRTTGIVDDEVKQKWDDYFDDDIAAHNLEWLLDLIDAYDLLSSNPNSWT